MRTHLLAGIRLRRRVATTDEDRSARRFPDLIGRDFRTGEPGLRCVGDIPPQARDATPYLPIADGTILDPGWETADHMRSELVEDTLTAAARLTKAA